MPRACSPPRSPLSSSLSAPALTASYPSVCPAPTLFRLFQRRRFLKPLILTGEKGSLISLPEIPCSGGKVLALGRATKNEVYPKEGNGCLCDISSFTIKGLSVPVTLHGLGMPVQRRQQEPPWQVPHGETRPAWSCGPSEHLSTTEP